ncbi:NtaA/DmoA family FMN-dependent monooxygenase [Herbiconiux moechotypicola]|uniref:NtaA/DmoA family FMN-dependent monooxygenase n=1 Tax=Herbiconiux moechotypicola TaxID=637393 RepID=A0ABP5Q7V3_9MICO|nr:NtaA/DmoA family FMN-dependent monooxygenase [Herbiconiux moechotypicola]MCS5729131.1 NtaA/DmoA family FMN-dependent monooxygenase [Herbiconiux moechotypicola]
MPVKKFHLGWFAQYRVPVWYRGSDPWAGNVGRQWQDGTFLIDMARILDRACFDFMILEDSSKVPDAMGGSFEADLRQGRFAPKHDPIPLVPLLAQATKNIGFLATMSTTFYPPYILARLMSTLDHVTHGRAGWNIVTSSGDAAAQNFNLDRLFEHDLRYDIADEFTEVVTDLWKSWEPDALVADQASGTYVDHTKVHEINHRGEFFKVKGPLNTLPSPQHIPVLSQAGASSRGMEFAARHAEVILAPVTTIAGMKAFRDSIHERMTAYGRAPEQCKIMYLVEPILGVSEADARERREARDHPSDYELEDSLDIMSAHSEIDFSKFDLDAPLPPGLTTNGHQSGLAGYYQMGSTVREIATKHLQRAIVEELVGTPQTVATRMGEIIDEVGGDGFLIAQAMTRTYITEIADGLVPALQEQGRVRTRYSYEHFRDNLMEF